tara:strand:- start:9883 stop:10089 length:207 start_codon:yes stop_codon:yes gene_type:complete
MTPTTDEFANTVKNLRAQLGLSQEDLSKKLGVSFATINRWENGKNHPSKLAKKQFEQFYKEQQEQGTL